MFPYIRVGAQLRTEEGHRVVDSILTHVAGGP